MIDMNLIVGWMFTVVTSLSQPGALATTEDLESRSARLSSISQDIAEVVFDEKEEPMFLGERGREKSAVFVATWASYESGHFDKGVDDGTIRGDHGSSWCMMQIHIGGGKTPQGWTGKDLIKDRKKCIQSGYRILKSSWKTCRGPEAARGAMYISGRCDWAVKDSVARSGRALRIFKENTLENYSRSLDPVEFEPGSLID